jgi:hypothetical protein
MVGEEIACIDRRCQIELLLLSFNSLDVLIYGAIFKPYLFSRGASSDSLKDILKELVVKVCEHVSEVHASWNEHMICLEALGILYKTVYSPFYISYDVPELVLELCFDGFSLALKSEDV